MYKVRFYRDKSGESEIVDYLDDLKKRGLTSKTDRIIRNKILSYIAALEQYGTRIGEPVVKHIIEDIWELRPINNRILFFYWKDNRFVLLHCFVKKSNKTPQREIKRAQSKMKDYIERYGE